MSHSEQAHGETVENNDGDEIDISGHYRTESFLEKVRAVARKFAGREGYVNFNEGVQGKQYLPTNIDVTLKNTTATESELVNHDNPVIDCKIVSFDTGTAKEPVPIPEQPADHHDHAPVRDVYIRYRME